MWISHRCTCVPSVLNLLPTFHPFPPSRLLQGASLLAKMVKNPPAMQETWVWSLAQGESLAKEMAAHSSVLAWRIPWTEEPGRLQSVGSQRVGHDWLSTVLVWVTLHISFGYKMRILMWVIHWETFSGEIYKDIKEVGYSRERSWAKCALLKSNLSLIPLEAVACKCQHRVFSPLGKEVSYHALIWVGPGQYSQ